MNEETEGPNILPEIPHGFTERVAVLKWRDKANHHDRGNPISIRIVTL
jgi:hypothetical protein